LLLAASLAACGGPGSSRDGSRPLSGWPEYGGDKGGMRYARANQITSDNVDELEVAWVHRNGDYSLGSDGSARTSFNVTPILVDDTLVFCTPMNRVVAIDAETGPGPAPVPVVGASSPPPWMRC
jgi:quinoprotein glucose dehydrogenase